MVEWFIAPVLKTGDPSRGPGVRIPPPLQKKEKQGPDSVGAFCFEGSKRSGLEVGKGFSELYVDKFERIDVTNQRFSSFEVLLPCLFLMADFYDFRSLYFLKFENDFF